LTFVRVDSDHVDNLIKKNEEKISALNDEEKDKLKGIIENYIQKEKFTVQMQAMDSNQLPIMITQPEFMRRMKEMSATGGGMFGMGKMPEIYNLVVNTNHELSNQILNNSDSAVQEKLVKQAVDLAKLSQNLLQGEELTAFVKRSFELMN
jgi:molecular chaperone HtpG